MRGLLAAAVALTSAATLTVAPSYAEHDRQPARSKSQTSDGVRGERALPIPEAFRVADVWTTLQAYPIAPGVSFEQFTLTGVRGVTRGQLVRVDLATPGSGSASTWSRGATSPPGTWSPT